MVAVPPGLPINTRPSGRLPAPTVHWYGGTPLLAVQVDAYDTPGVDGPAAGAQLTVMEGRTVTSGAGGLVPPNRGIGAKPFPVSTVDAGANPPATVPVPLNA